MPIRPALRKYYGADWRRFKVELIAARGAICEQCGVEVPHGINGAHQTHNPRDRRSVKLWCPSCHARHDAPHRIAMMRRTRAAATGQLWLLPELEWAPFASWEIPARVADVLLQLRLF